GLQYSSILLNPHLILPDFKQIDSLNLEMDDPLIAYSESADDYPASCINCEDNVLDRGSPPDFVTTVFVLAHPLLNFLNRTHLNPVPVMINIMNCTASSFGDPQLDCEVCPVTNTFGGV